MHETPATQFEQSIRSVAAGFVTLSESMQEAAKGMDAINAMFEQWEADIRNELTPEQREIYNWLRLRGIPMFNAQEAAIACFKD